MSFKKCLTVLLLFVCLVSVTRAQSVCLISSSDTLQYGKKRPFWAVGEVLLFNVGVWAIDRYAFNHDFAKINGHTIKQNFRNGFVWDNDIMGTNFISHPYHGSLYYNSARANGFNLYQSIPFTLGGSLIWECFLETEPPSVNDLILTTAGGVAFGEITYRLSDKIIDNSAGGLNRVFREIAGGIISPARALSRLITGEAWKRSAYNSGHNVPLDLNLSLGARALRPRIGAQYAYYAEIEGDLVYNPEKEECELPFDWFSVKMALDVGNSSFFIRRLDVNALWWNAMERTLRNGQLSVGLYQHLNYWDSPLKIYQQTPFRFSQGLALGPGLNYRNNSSHAVDIDYNLYLSAIGMGAAQVDYLWVGARDYNFGSGASIHTDLNLSFFHDQLYLKLAAGNYNLFTWKGVCTPLIAPDTPPHLPDVQGIKAYVNFSSFESELGYQSKENWNVALTTSFVNRYNDYRCMPTRQYSTWSFAVKMGYRIF